MPYTNFSLPLSSVQPDTHTQHTNILTVTHTHTHTHTNFSLPPRSVQPDTVWSLLYTSSVPMPVRGEVRFSVRVNKG